MIAGSIHFLLKVKLHIEMDFSMFLLHIHSVTLSGRDVIRMWRALTQLKLIGNQTAAVTHSKSGVALNYQKDQNIYLCRALLNVKGELLYYVCHFFVAIIHNWSEFHKAHGALKH